MASRIIQDRKNLRAITLWLELKALFYDGRFKKAHKRIREISDYLRIGERSYRYKMIQLEKIGLITYDREDMVLCSWRKFQAYFGRVKESNRFKYYRIKNAYNAEYLIRRLAVQENFSRQKYQIEKKVFLVNAIGEREMKLMEQIYGGIDLGKIALKDRQRLSGKLIEKLNDFKNRDPKRLYRQKAKLKKAGVLAKWEVKEMDSYFRQLFQMNGRHSINFDISISCKRLAEIYGLKSASSGWYWEQMLKAKEMITVVARAIRLNGDPVNQSIYRMEYERESGQELAHHFVGRKGIFKRLNNQITLLPLQEQL